jgi:hypothetical protein
MQLSIKLMKLEQDCLHNKFKSPQSGACVDITSRTGKTILIELLEKTKKGELCISVPEEKMPTFIQPSKLTIEQEK